MRPFFVWISVGFLTLLLLGCMGLAVPIDLGLSLVFGWVLFLGRISEVRINGSGLITGAVCLALFAVGLHLFLGWLHGQVQGQGGGPSSSQWKRSWTTSLVAIIVLMFVAGLASVGVAHQTGWLVTSSEPLLSSGGSYTAARRAQSLNNLKQIGLALYNYHEVMASLPPGGTFDPQGRGHHSWQALILAQQTENQALYNQINFDLPWNNRVNSTAFRTTLWTYLNPGIQAFKQDGAGYALSHYAGNVLVLGGDKNRAFKDITDGGEHTIMAGEAPAGFKPWGNPTNWRDPAKGINRSPDGFGGPYKGGAGFLFVDGSVRFIKDTADPRIFKALGTPSGGEVISDDNY